jgi:hypothetical protein
LPGLAAGLWLPELGHVSQAARMKDRKNPAAVAKALSGLPCSNASGMRVSASDASTAPPAERQCNGEHLLAEHAGDAAPQHHGRRKHDRADDPRRHHRPTALSRLSHGHGADQSLRLEKKIATSSDSETPVASDVPSARFSGTPSNVTAASSASPPPPRAAVAVTSRSSGPPRR